MLGAGPCGGGPGGGGPGGGGPSGGGPGGGGHEGGRPRGGGGSERAACGLLSTFSCIALPSLRIRSSMPFLPLPMDPLIPLCPSSRSTLPCGGPVGGSPDGNGGGRSESPLEIVGSLFVSFVRSFVRSFGRSFFVVPDEEGSRFELKYDV